MYLLVHTYVEQGCQMVYFKKTKIQIWVHSFGKDLAMEDVGIFRAIYR
jgi:hypothetical protein